MTDRIEFESERARRYRKRSEILAFESKDAVTYHKSWGKQDLPEGGWVAIALDERGLPTGEVYGIDEEAFAETYAPSMTGRPHRFMKTATVEAYKVGHEFSVRTELDDTKAPGVKRVEVEDNRASATAMLVRNPGGEVYTIEREEFERMYVEVRSPRRPKNRNEHLDPTFGAKRILTLDGGGVRNVLSLGVLASVEQMLRRRHHDDSLVLSDYFDLIAGTSTGAIVGAGLAAGRSVAEMIDWFRPVAPKIFGRRWTAPLLRPKHDPGPLTKALKSLFEEHRLDSEALKTGLLVVTKRLDARGVWPVANNPNDPEWSSDADANRPGTALYVLREVLRASAAAPFPLQSERIRVFGGESSLPAEQGQFINGGISPHNNPSLQALMIASRGEHGLGWTTGAERLLMVSVGAGRSDEQHELRDMSLTKEVRSLHGILNEAAEQVEAIMQWLSESDTSRELAASIGTLRGELLAEQPVLSYARYDAPLDADWLKSELDVDLPEANLREMRPLDARSGAIDRLLDLGRKLGEKRVQDGHFPAAFDLPKE